MRKTAVLDTVRPPIEAPTTEPTSPDGRTEQWRRTGAAPLSGVIDDAGWDALVREAVSCEPAAADRINDCPGLMAYRDGSITSPQRCRAHRGGSALRALAIGPALLEAARAVTGQCTLVPARYGFKYYRPGDFMAVHRDSVKCAGITVSFALTENLGPMGWLPQLRDASNDAVLAHIGAEPFPSDGEEFPLTDGMFHGFDGYNIPHWRPPHAGDGVAILGTVCFFAL
ncbi:hypothetical protein [Dactylosporangium sp. NPDC005555]|uniref:hypothetical protein n=1 Tax=Dactylosporangium sp. NPDC005555 TaxID=3154889 RepID=UPI0033BE26C4